MFSVFKRGAYTANCSMISFASSLRDGWMGGIILTAWSGAKKFRSADKKSCNILCSGVRPNKLELPDYLEPFREALDSFVPSVDAETRLGFKIVNIFNFFAFPLLPPAPRELSASP